MPLKKDKSDEFVNRIWEDIMKFKKDNFRNPKIVKLGYDEHSLVLDHPDKHLVHAAAEFGTIFGIPITQRAQKNYYGIK